MVVQDATPAHPSFTPRTPERALYTRFLRGLGMSGTASALRLGAEQVSYAELHRLALGWAGSLLAACEEPPSAIGVLAGKGIESYAGILAVLYTGAAVVPLHPNFPAERTRRMLRMSAPSALIADRQGLGTLSELAGEFPDLPVLAPDAGNLMSRATRRIGVRDVDALGGPRPVADADSAYILFTSGSTGRPKGVPISHGSTRHYFELLDRRYDFGPSDVFSQTFDLNFDCAMFDLFTAWGAGAAVHPVPAAAYRDIPAFVADRELTVWFSTPSAIALQRRMSGLGHGAMPGLRWSFFAGEALLAEDAADWQAAAPHATVENLYGPTELTVTVTGYRWDPVVSPGLCVNGMVPIGAVHEGHQHLLLAEDGEVTDDAEGELCITGPQMTKGYLDPRDDENRFLHARGRSWYRTGDRVRELGDGELVYLGRRDSQVQVNGWRVELAEVEHAVRSMTGVIDAVVVTKPVDGSLELVVFYTGTPARPAELAAHLRGILPTGMVPKEYRHLEEFPLNANKKIDRLRLAERSVERAG